MHPPPIAQIGYCKSAIPQLDLPQGTRCRLIDQACNFLLEVAQLFLVHIMNDGHKQPAGRLDSNSDVIRIG